MRSVTNIAPSGRKGIDQGCCNPSVTTTSFETTFLSRLEVQPAMRQGRWLPDDWRGCVTGVKFMRSERRHPQMLRAYRYDCCRCNGQSDSPVTPDRLLEGFHVPPRNTLAQTVCHRGREKATDPLQFTGTVCVWMNLQYLTIAAWDGVTKATTPLISRWGDSARGVSSHLGTFISSSGTWSEHAPCTRWKSWCRNLNSEIVSAESLR